MDDSNKAQRALRAFREIRIERRAAEESNQLASGKLQKAAFEQANFDAKNLEREEASRLLVEGLNSRWWYYGGTIGEELVKYKTQLDLSENRQGGRKGGKQNVPTLLRTFLSPRQVSQARIRGIKRRKRRRRN